MPEQHDDSVFTARAKQRKEARELMGALLAGVDDRTRAVVREAMRRSGSLLYVVSHLLDTARHEVEDMWYRGDIAMVDQRRMMGSLEAMVRDASSEAGGTAPPFRSCILTAANVTAAGTINRRLLEEDGWNVKELDIDDVVDEARNLPWVERRVAVLVGGAESALPDLRSPIAGLQALGSRVLVVAPGHWLQAGHWQQLGADASAEDARTMLLLARRLYAADTTFSISEVAASLRVSTHAIRVWERRYRLPTPARDRGGQRRYTAEDVQLLFRVSHAATVRGHSLRLASLEAQGLLSEDVTDVPGPLTSAATQISSIQTQAWLHVADAIPDILMLVDGEGRIVDCNVATARLRDTVRENLRGMKLADLVIDYDRAKAVRLYRPTPRRRDAWELRMPSPGDNKLRVVAFDSRVIVTREGRLLGLVGRIVPAQSIESAAEIA